MAEEKIQFTLGAIFKGNEAFKQLNTDVKNSQREFKDMSRSSIGVLKSIAGTMDGELNGTLTRSISLLSDLSRGGLWGVMGAAAQLGIGMAIEGLQKLVAMAEESSDRLITLISHANDFKESLNRIADSKAIAKMKDALKEATTGAKEAMEAIESAAAAVNSISSAQGQTAAAKVQEELAKIMRDKAKAVANSLNEFDKAVISAKADLDAANVEMTEAQRAAAASVAAAQRGVETAQQKQMQAIENLVAAQRAVEIAETDYKKAKIHGNVKLQEYERTLEAARAAEKAAQAAKNKADADVTVALEKHTAAESLAAASVAKAETKVVELTAARDEVIRKHNEQIEAEQSLFNSTNVLSEGRKKEASLIDENIKAMKEQRDALKKEGEAKEKELQGRIDAGEAEIRSIGEMRKNLDKGELAYLKHHGWMGEAFERNGTGGIASFKDFMKGMRWKGRYDRDMESADRSNNARADKIRSALDAGKKVSDSDRKFLQNWEDFKKQRDGGESIENDIRSWKEEQTRVAEETKTAVEKIEERIKETLALK
jgi:hypothetical protein